MFFLAFVVLFLLTWGVVYAAAPVLRGGASYLARFVVRNVRVTKLMETHGQRLRDYWPVVALLLLGAALTAWAGDGFIDLAELVHSKSSILQQTDLRIHDWAITRRAGDATIFFVTMTIIGGPVGLAVIGGLVAIALFVTRRYRWAIYLAVTAGGGGLLNEELKRYFARARPDVAEMLRAAHGYSFPSGHAMGSTVVLGALAYLASRAIPRWRWKSAAIALAMVLIASIALSRVYLGVHWVSDIAAGVSAGAVWLTSTTVAYEVLRRIRRLRTMRSPTTDEKVAP
jgi:undecaprenyl-diphosphatase